jgi:hypothetical protein
MSFDKNSDLQLVAPNFGVFHGIAMYIDRNFTKGVPLSGRALAGPLGGITGVVYARDGNIMVRGGTKNVSELTTPIKASFIVGSVRFGGNVDQCDEDDPDCATETACDVDVDPECVPDAEDDDPGGIFQPQDPLTATRMVFAPVE